MEDKKEMKKLKDKILEKDKGFIDDAIVIILDLVHCEIHSMLEHIQTGNMEFLNLANELRKDRTNLFDEIAPNFEGEQRCLFGKHLPRVIGGYIEVGSRMASAGLKKDAVFYFNIAGKYLRTLYYFIEKSKGGEKK